MTIKTIQLSLYSWLQKAFNFSPQELLPLCVRRDVLIRNNNNNNSWVESMNDTYITNACHTSMAFSGETFTNSSNSIDGHYLQLLDPSCWRQGASYLSLTVKTISLALALLWIHGAPDDSQQWLMEDMTKPILAMKLNVPSEFRHINALAVEVSVRDALWSFDIYIAPVVHNRLSTLSVWTFVMWRG